MARTLILNRGETALMATNDSDESANVPDEGDIITYERTFTVEEVREFSKITGDQQAIHTELDEEGRLTVPGVLVGSLMTKIGGDLSYIARTIECEFRRPVYTGEAITCKWTVELKTEREDRYLLENAVVFYDGSDNIVGDGSTTGLIQK